MSKLVIFLLLAGLLVVPDSVDGNCHWRCAVRCSRGRRCCSWVRECYVRKRSTDNEVKLAELEDKPIHETY